MKTLRSIKEIQKYLESSAQKNTTQEEAIIDLTYSPLRAEDISKLENAIAVFTEKTKSPPLITKIHLKHCRITSDLATQLTTTLELLPNLKVLDLSSNIIDDAGAIAIANIAKKLRNLCILSMESCKITNLGANTVLELVGQYNEQLKIYLANNCYTSEPLLHAISQQANTSCTTTTTTTTSTQHSVFQHVFGLGSYRLSISEISVDIVKFMNSDQCQQNAMLTLPSCFINGYTLNPFLQALLSQGCNKPITIDMRGIMISKDCIELLEKIMNSPKCKSVQITLDYCKGMEHLIEICNQRQSRNTRETVAASTNQRCGVNSPLQLLPQSLMADISKLATLSPTIPAALGDHHSFWDTCAGKHDYEHGKDRSSLRNSSKEICPDDYSSDESDHTGECSLQ